MLMQTEEIVGARRLVKHVVRGGRQRAVALAGMHVAVRVVVRELDSLAAQLVAHLVAIAQLIGNVDAIDAHHLLRQRPLVKVAHAVAFVVCKIHAAGDASLRKVGYGLRREGNGRGKTRQREHEAQLLARRVHHALGLPITIVAHEAEECCIVDGPMRCHARTSFSSVAVTTLAPVPSGGGPVLNLHLLFVCALCVQQVLGKVCEALFCVDGNQREHIELPAIGSRGEDRDARCVNGWTLSADGRAADDGVSVKSGCDMLRFVARARARPSRRRRRCHDSVHEGLGQCFEKEADAKRAARLKLMSRRPTWPHATDPIIADSHVKDLEQSITIPSACSTGGPSLLAIGVLTMPILVRTPDQRRYHRAVHYSQSAMRAGRICMRYLVSESEMARLKPAASAVVADENATHSDLLVLPDVPRGPLESTFESGGVRGWLRAQNPRVVSACLSRVGESAIRRVRR